MYYSQKVLTLVSTLSLQVVGSKKYGLAISTPTTSRSGPPKKKEKRNDTKDGKQNYSTRDSHVVTHHSTNLAIHCLTRAERTGSRAFSVL
jgi:hypothetical protein